MIVSRFAGVCRLPASKNLLLQSNKNGVTKTIGRNCHTILYRKTHRIEDEKCKAAVFLGTFTWWWLFWNAFTNYELLTGHSYPDPSKWTDEELGIPTDD